MIPQWPKSARPIVGARVPSFIESGQETDFMSRNPQVRCNERGHKLPMIAIR